MDIYLELQDFCRKLYPFTDSVVEKFSNRWIPISYKRKEIITEANQVEKYLYFISEGVQRVFYLDDDGREATLVLTYSHSFGGVVDSFLTGQRSRYYYETLTPSTLLKISYSDLEELKRESSEVDIFIQQATHHALAGVLERMVELQCFSSEEKFKKLLIRSPHILRLVPHKYLANYLGIDPTNFSKLINRVKI